MLAAGIFNDVVRSSSDVNTGRAPAGSALMPSMGHDRSVTGVRIWLPLLAWLLFGRLPGLDVTGIRSGAVDMAEMQRRYAAGERACGLALACGHAYGVGVPLNENACDSLLVKLIKAGDLDTLLKEDQPDTSGFIDYTRSLALHHKDGGHTPESLPYLRRAADKGFAMAMYDLAMFQHIRRSRGDSLNAEATRERLGAAARAGSLVALTELRTHHLYETDQAETRAQCAVLAEPLLLRSLSDKAHEDNLKIAGLAEVFGLYRLSHTIRVAAVKSGLSEEHCKLPDAVRQLAWLEKQERQQAKTAGKPKPPLQPELQPDERAMITIPMGSGWAADLARFHAQDLKEFSLRSDRRGAWGERIDFVIDLSARYMGGVIGFPTEAFLESTVNDLLSAGCQDPAVWFLACSLFQAGGRPSQDDQLVRIYEALKAQDAPRYLRVDCAEMICWRAFLLRSTPERQQRGERFLQIYIDEAVEALPRPMHSQQERTLFARVLSVAHRTFEAQDWHLRCFAALKQAMAKDAASTPTIDPWLRNMVEGSILLSEGWKVRGTGYASTVSTDQWKIFNEHLAQSRVLIERAYTIDPSLPDTAIIRLTVAMGTSEGAEVVKEWRDKALAAAPEHRDAYRMAMVASARRWGGSPTAILDVGRRGVATNAYHTTAPLRFLNALEVAGKEAGDAIAFGKQHWPEARAVLQTYIDRTEDPMLRRWHQTALAAYSYKYGHADEVQELLKGPLKGQVIAMLAKEILDDWYVTDQLLAVAGQE